MLPKTDMTKATKTLIKKDPNIDNPYILCHITKNNTIELEVIILYIHVIEDEQNKLTQILKDYDNKYNHCRDVHKMKYC